MGRLPKDVCFKKRGKFWYYKLKGEKFRSSGETSKVKCEKKAFELLHQKNKDMINISFREYAENYYIWGACPHITRLVEEGKSISRRYARTGRKTIEKHVFSSPLADLNMGEIKRSHLFDFRTALMRLGLAAGSVNRIMGFVKVIFNEAEYRQDIVYNPTKGVGKVKGPSRTPDVFSQEELSILFSPENRWIWGKNSAGFTSFYLAAATGMRKGEILALEWRHIHFDENYIIVEQSWKDRNELGLPKWEKKRFACLSESLKAILLEYRSNLSNSELNSLVFCKKDGSRYSDSWWTNIFFYALKSSGIHTEGRVLVPHSFRHTACTMLLNAGENPEKIRATLGWSNEDMQKLYTHWKPEHMKNQGRIMDSILPGIL